jgi:hypothetical protein
MWWRRIWIRILIWFCIFWDTRISNQKNMNDRHNSKEVYRCSWQPRSTIKTRIMVGLFSVILVLCFGRKPSIFWGSPAWFLSKIGWCFMTFLCVKSSSRVRRGRFCMHFSSAIYNIILWIWFIRLPPWIVSLCLLPLRWPLSYYHWHNVNWRFKASAVSRFVHW